MQISKAFDNRNAITGWKAIKPYIVKVIYVSIGQ